MSNFVEYIFYSRDLFEQFAEALDERNIGWQEGSEAIHESILVQVNEGDLEPYWDEVDDLYDELEAMDQQLLQQGEIDDDDINAAGVHIQLEGDNKTIARVKPDVLNRILEVITPQEFTDFVDAIVSSVENPDTSPLCKKVPE